MTMTIRKPRHGDTDREAVFERKRAERNAAIDRIISEEKAKGLVLDRLLASIAYDLHHAPRTTNLRQLAEIGIHPPAVDALDAEDLADALRIVIDGMASLGIYLRDTDHLDDRRLYAVLLTQVLAEEVRDIPPTDEVSEFIDLGSVAPAGARDGDDGDDGDGANCAENGAIGAGDGDGIEAFPSPLHPKVTDRDRHLPVPKRMEGGRDHDRS